MMIIGLLEGLIELVIVGGAILYLYRDYKRDWKGIKSIAGWIQAKFGRKFSPTEIAENLLNDHARVLDLSRRAIARVEANYRMALQQAQEHKELIKGFFKLELRALRDNDEKGAITAAHSKIEAEKRVQIFANFAQESRQILEGLKDELDNSEMDFEAKKTVVETIRISSEIAEARRQQYNLISEVSVESGLTAHGKLEQLLRQVQCENFEAEALLNLVKDNGKTRLERFLRQEALQYELESARKRLNLLPQASSLDELDETDGDNQNNGEVVIEPEEFSKEEFSRKV